MANIANIKVFFDGTHKKLEEVKNLIVKTGRFGKDEIDFSHVAPFLPGINNQHLYELFGCNWDNYVLDKYSQEEISAFDKKVETFIQAQGWIGMRDSYINESSHNVSAYYKDKTLVVETDFKWNSPTLFFAKIATDLGVSFKALEFVEGNNTWISFIDESGKCTDIKNSHRAIIENTQFRDYAIDMGLHTPAQLVTVAMCVDKKNLALELIKDYKVSSDDFSFALVEMQEFAKEPWDMYQSSPFINLGMEKIKDMSAMKMMHNFASLETQIEKMNHPKIK